MTFRASRLKNLDYWFTLSRVASLGSMNKAAEELGIDVSSVSNKIKAIETELGQKLLERKAHASYLTTEGERALKLITPLLDQFLYSIDQLHSDNSEDRVTLRLNVSNGLLILMVEWMKDFCKKYPEVDIELTDNKSLDLGHQLGFDIAIFANYSQKPPGECRDLGVAPTYLVASREYLDKHPIHSPEEMINHRVLSCYNWNCGQRFLYGEAGSIKIPVRWKNFFGFDNNTTLVTAVEKSVGIGWGVPAYLCEEQLKSGKLVRLFEPYESVGLHFFLATGSVEFKGIRQKLLEYITESWRKKFKAYRTMAPCYALR